MEVATTSLLILLGLAAASIAAGIALSGRTTGSSFAARALPATGWLLVIFGTIVSAAIAGLQLTGRLGPAQLWFRAPSFYVAAAILLAVATWWFRRRFDHPHARLIRYGLPGLAVIFLGLIVILQRTDGRSTPISAFLPTLRSVGSGAHLSGNRRQVAQSRGLPRQGGARELLGDVVHPVPQGDADVVGCAVGVQR